jgi:uncharacterized protein (DUF2147 family)
MLLHTVLKRLTLLFIVITTPVMAGVQSEKFGKDAILGIWINEEKSVKVRIERIGNKYHGKIIWLERPNWPDGTVKLDKFNPDQSLRERPFIGMRTVMDLTYMGRDTWGGGKLYDPEEGKTYGCKISLDQKDVATIRGYIGLTLLGRSVYFYRVNA